MWSIAIDHMVKLRKNIFVYISARLGNISQIQILANINVQCICIHELDVIFRATDGSEDLAG